MKSSNRFFSNILFNGLYLLVSVLINLWLTPYLINNMGVEIYGLVPLAITITSYLDLFTLSITGAIGRYLTIDLAKNDDLNADITFNSAFWGFIILLIFLIPGVVALSYYSPFIFNIPKGQESSTRILFFLVSSAFVISAVQSIFAVSLWANYRFELKNIILVVGALFRVGTIIICFSFISQQIYFVGLGMFVASIITLLGNVHYWSKLTSQLTLSLKKFKLPLAWEMMNMGWWLSLNQLGLHLFVGSDLVLVNLLLGPVMTGIYGTIVIFPTMLRTLSSLIVSVISPVIMRNYGIGNKEGVLKVSTKSIEYLFLFLSFPIGLICGFSKPILSIWINAKFSENWLLLVILVIHLPFTLSISPLSPIIDAYKAVKLQGLATLFLGFFNILFAFSLIEIFGFGIWGITIAFLLTLTIKNLIFYPLYVVNIMQEKWYLFYLPIIKGIIPYFFLLISSYWIQSNFFIDTWQKLIFISLGLFIFYFGYVAIKYKKNSDSLIFRYF